MSKVAVEMVCVCVCEVVGGVYGRDVYLLCPGQLTEPKQRHINTCHLRVN